MYLYVKKSSSNQSRFAPVMQRLTLSSGRYDFLHQQQLTEILGTSLTINDRWVCPVSNTSGTCAANPVFFNIMEPELLSAHLCFFIDHCFLSSISSAAPILDIRIRNPHYTARPASQQAAATSVEGSHNVAGNSMHWTDNPEQARNRDSVINYYRSSLETFPTMVDNRLWEITDIANDRTDIQTAVTAVSTSKLTAMISHPVTPTINFSFN